ncbi:MAG: hypothetical protein Q7J06_02235 [Bacteroidales bacterium]|nr:hypothetical protein [Bacteroidales bacterium]
MIKRGRSILYRIIDKYFAFLVFSLLLLLISIYASSASGYGTNLANVSPDLTVVFTKPIINLILTLLGTLLVVCAVIIFFSIKLKRVNKELQKKNTQISDINIDLQKYNSELAIQKDLITKEYKLSPVKDSMKAKSDSDTKMDIM